MANAPQPLNVERFVSAKLAAVAEDNADTSSAQLADNARASGPAPGAELPKRRSPVPVLPAAGQSTPETSTMPRMCLLSGSMRRPALSAVAERRPRVLSARSRDGGQVVLSARPAGAKSRPAQSPVRPSNARSLSAVPPQRTASVGPSSARDQNGSTVPLVPRLRSLETEHACGQLSLAHSQSAAVLPAPFVADALPSSVAFGPACGTSASAPLQSGFVLPPQCLEKAGAVTRSSHRMTDSRSEVSLPACPDAGCQRGGSWWDDFVQMLSATPPVLEHTEGDLPSSNVSSKVPNVFRSLSAVLPQPASIDVQSAPERLVQGGAMAKPRLAGVRSMHESTGAIHSQSAVVLPALGPSPRITNSRSGAIILKKASTEESWRDEFARVHDTLALSYLPGNVSKAYGYFEHANGIHVKGTGRPSPIALYNMARCLSLATAASLASGAGRGSGPAVHDVPPFVPHLLACPKSLVKARLDLALGTLRSAVEAGFDNYEQMQSDPDLRAVQEEYPSDFAGLAGLARSRRLRSPSPAQSPSRTIPTASRRAASPWLCTGGKSVSRSPSPTLSAGRFLPATTRCVASPRSCGREASSRNWHVGIRPIASPVLRGWRL